MIGSDYRIHHCDIDMSFRQFSKWCSRMARKGIWSYNHAITFCSIKAQIQELPFWKREKRWCEVKKHYLPIIELMKRKGV